MKWAKESTFHQVEREGLVKKDFTLSMIADNGVRIVAVHRQPGSIEVTFIVTDSRLDANGINHVADAIAQALESGPAGKELRRKLDQPLSECNFSVRTANCCNNSGWDYVGQLVQKSEADLLRSKNFGRQSLREVRDALSSMGLMLGMKPSQLDGWTPPGTPAT